MCVCVCVFQVSAQELTLVHNLRKLVKNDWVSVFFGNIQRDWLNCRLDTLCDCVFSPQCGGAVITTLAQTGSLYTPSSAYLPHELLGEVRGHGIFSSRTFHSCFQKHALDWIVMRWFISHRRALTPWSPLSLFQSRTTARKSLRVVTCTI